MGLDQDLRGEVGRDNLRMYLPDGHVSVLGLTCLGTALQWCLGDSWHGFVHQHLLVLHSLTWTHTEDVYDEQEGI